jgi:hypothetical protein
MNLFHSILSIGILFLTSGCASYRFGNASDPGFKSIFIENFRNDSDEPHLENLVTTTVIKEFQNDGTLIVTDASSAEVILQGRIITFQMSPVLYSRQNEITPTQVSMSIGVKYSLTRRGQKKAFREGQATGSSTFFIGGDLQSDKRLGVPLASEELGRNMVSDLSGSWR